MAIYTKTGDKLTTGLITGRANKGSIRIESYGNTDEVLTYIGSLYSKLGDQKVKEQLEVIMQMLFNMGADLANPQPSEVVPFFVKKNDVQTIEAFIDEMDDQLPPLTKFLYPIGTEHATLANEIRALVRRAERRIVLLDTTLEEGEQFNKNILPLINRLSDYFFILYRYLNHQANYEEKEVFFDN